MSIFLVIIYRTTANHISIERCDDFCFKVDPQA